MTTWLDKLRKGADAKIAAQECAEQMVKLMRTDAQKMQAQLVDLYKHKMSRESMIAFYLEDTEDCKSKLQQPETSAEEREKCVFWITKHESSIEHHSKRLQKIEEKIQHLDVSKEFAEAAMAKVLDEKRQNSQKDDLEKDLEYYYAEYRYHRDEAELGRKRPCDREQRDLFLQKIGEMEEHIAKRRRCSPVGL
jgi:hypothetical protein